ncbi:hypothetical protein SDC9_208870 [bioreactor metagenome]|jgi:hypothetical protein|uniref:Uncharacterized protein n=1 Tax=bioreactor metagenome TaxID=1076179 RepID=A0A645JCH0_9ZZZZ
MYSSSDADSSSASLGNPGFAVDRDIDLSLFVMGRLRHARNRHGQPEPTLRTRPQRYRLRTGDVITSHPHHQVDFEND